LELAERFPERCGVLDASSTPDVLAEAAWALLVARLGLS
jgi:hypothetical protein